MYFGYCLQDNEAYIALHFMFFLIIMPACFLPVCVSATATERRHIPSEHASGPAGEAAGAPAHAVCPLSQTPPGLRQMQRELRWSGAHSS